MKTAQEVLSAKGYDHSEIDDLISYGIGLDMDVRTEFGLDNEPVHLWEAYYKGDANEEVLAEKAKEFGCDSIDSLLHLMDIRLIELCEEVEEKAEA